MQSSEINAAAWVKAVSLSDPQILHLCLTNHTLKYIL